MDETMNDETPAAAFPSVTHAEPEWYDNDHRRSGAFPSRFSVRGTTGMTLRDYFAGQALVAFLMGTSLRETLEHVSDETGDAVETVTAQWAYDQADAMLVARKGVDDGSR